MIWLDGSGRPGAGSGRMLSDDERALRGSGVSYCIRGHAFVLPVSSSLLVVGYSRQLGMPLPWKGYHCKGRAHLLSQRILLSSRALPGESPRRLGFPVRSLKPMGLAISLLSARLRHDDRCDNRHKTDLGSWQYRLITRQLLSSHPERTYHRQENLQSKSTHRSLPSLMIRSTHPSSSVSHAISLSSAAFAVSVRVFAGGTSESELISMISWGIVAWPRRGVMRSKVWEESEEMGGRMKARGFQFNQCAFGQSREGSHSLGSHSPSGYSIQFNSILFHPIHLAEIPQSIHKPWHSACVLHNTLLPFHA